MARTQSNRPASSHYLPTKDCGDQEWLTKVAEDVYQKIVTLLKYTCCVPEAEGDKFCYAFKPSNDNSIKQIRFSVPPPEISEVEMPSPLAFDSLEVPENSVTTIKKKIKKKKKKIKKFFKKIKNRSSGSSSKSVKCNRSLKDKCCGECKKIVSRWSMSLVSQPSNGTTTSNSSSHSVTKKYEKNSELPQVPKKMSNLQRVTRFFDDIYINFMNFNEGVVK